MNKPVYSEILIVASRISVCPLFTLIRNLRPYCSCLVRNPLAPALDTAVVLVIQNAPGRPNFQICDEFSLRLSSRGERIAKCETLFFSEPTLNFACNVTMANTSHQIVHYILMIFPPDDT